MKEMPGTTEEWKEISAAEAQTIKQINKKCSRIRVRGIIKASV